jgi:hypothetical protein
VTKHRQVVVLESDLRQRDALSISIHERLKPKLTNLGSQILVGVQKARNLFPHRSIEKRFLDRRGAFKELSLHLRRQSIPASKYRGSKALQNVLLFASQCTPHQIPVTISPAALVLPS